MFTKISNWFSGFMGGMADRAISAVIILVIGVIALKLIMKMAATALSRSKLEKVHTD